MRLKVEVDKKKPCCIKKFSALKKTQVRRYSDPKPGLAGKKMGERTIIGKRMKKDTNLGS